MKQDTNEVLGFEQVLTNVPETLAEAVSLAGGEQAVLDAFIAYTTFHRHNGRSRDAIVEFLEKNTGIKPRGTGEGKDFVRTEKDLAYSARVRSEQPEKVKELEGSIRMLNSTVDWTPGTRGSGKLAAKWFAYYDKLVEDEKLDAFCTKHNIDQSLEEDALKAVVASKVKSIIEAKQRAIEKEALSDV